MSAEVVALTADESAELAAHEATIERGLKTFYEVGKALLAIRDGKLWRETHHSFDHYCRDRWGFLDRRAYELTTAAAIADVISSMDESRPQLTERQLRPLRTLQPGQQRKAWAKAVATTPEGKVTGKHVAATVWAASPSVQLYIWLDAAAQLYYNRAERTARLHAAEQGGNHG